MPLPPAPLLQGGEQINSDKQIAERKIVFILFPSFAKITKLREFVHFAFPAKLSPSVIKSVFLLSEPVPI